jgi:hypothetical protein
VVRRNWYCGIHQHRAESQSGLGCQAAVGAVSLLEPTIRKRPLTELLYTCRVPAYRLPRFCVCLAIGSTDTGIAPLYAVAVTKPESRRLAPTRRT